MSLEALALDEQDEQEDADEDEQENDATKDLPLHRNIEEDASCGNAEGAAGKLSTMPNETASAPTNSEVDSSGTTSAYFIAREPGFPRVKVEEVERRFGTVNFAHSLEVFVQNQSSYAWSTYDTSSIDTNR